LAFGCGPLQRVAPDSASNATGGAAGASAQAALPALPLRTESRFIVDNGGKRVKFAGVNWYGGESADFVPLGLDHNDLAAIAHSVKMLGFNVVRLPWSLELYEKNPLIADARLSHNPSLLGKHALDVLDAVVRALAHEGVMVVLDNHRSRGDWCCDTAHGDGLWHTADYPEESFVADWAGIVERYRSEPAVVGVDLRNEIRGQLPDGATGCTDCGNPNTPECSCLQPSWGDGNVQTDWALAAEKAGNAILEKNPNLLVIVGGNFWSTWFGASYRPLSLSVPNRLVYAPHNYASTNGGVASFADYDAFKAAMNTGWGFIVTPGQSYTAPLFLSEFGTNHNNVGKNDPSVDDGARWWAYIRRYLTEADIDWAVWALNGTQGAGYGRTYDAEETFGVLNVTWDGPGPAPYLTDLAALQAATSGP
jgi:endoglucanase